MTGARGLRAELRRRAVRAALRGAIRSGGAKLALGSTAGIVATLALLVVVVLVSKADLDRALGTPGECSAELVDAPARFAAHYTDAAERYRLGARGPAVLAAIHEVESGFGRNMGPSSAGAIGHMQFLPATWRAYGVDASGDGRRDPYDPADAIHGAANYLRASGAPRNWRAALFAYNRADWYVNLVLSKAGRFEGRLHCEAESGRLALGDLDFTDTSGAWGGSKKLADVARRLARRQGCAVSSAKRPGTRTASGGVSDHWRGARHSFAYDLARCSQAQMDATARAIAAAFGLPRHEGVVNATRGHYRIQLLWRTMVGGNHFNHVHLGVRNLCCGA